MWLSGFWIKTEGKATLFLEISCFFSGLPSAPGGCWKQKSLSDMQLAYVGLGISNK